MKNEIPMTHYVYILECSDKTLYTGSTNNTEKRLREHNHTKAGAKYTRGRRPVKLVYVEACPTPSIALKREGEIKNLSRAQKLRLIAASRGRGESF
jgi:putative endonuclease